MSCINVSSALGIISDGVGWTEQSLTACRPELKPESQYFRIHRFWRHTLILPCKCWHRKVALARKKMRDSFKWCNVMMSCDPQLLPDQSLSPPCPCGCHDAVKLLLLGGHQPVVWFAGILSFATEETPDRVAQEAIVMSAWWQCRGTQAAVWSRSSLSKV